MHGLDWATEFALAAWGLRCADRSGRRFCLGTPHAPREQLAAGVPIEAVEMQEQISLPEDFLGRGETFALRVRGVSKYGCVVRPVQTLTINSLPARMGATMVDPDPEQLIASAPELRSAFVGRVTAARLRRQRSVGRV